MDLESIVNSNLSNEDKLEALTRWLTPVIEGLEEIKSPSGAYSRCPLTHANNTIDSCSKAASALIDYLRQEADVETDAKVVLLPSLKAIPLKKGSIVQFLVHGGEVAAKVKNGRLEIIGVRRGEKEFSVLPQASNHIKIEFK